MKKIFAFLVLIGASLGGFFWWKRNQVAAANQVGADPWPEAVTGEPVSAVETPAQVSAPAHEPDLKKKATPKKSSAKSSVPPPAKASDSHKS